VDAPGRDLLQAHSFAQNARYARRWPAVRADSFAQEGRYLLQPCAVASRADSPRALRARLQPPRGAILHTEIGRSAAISPKGQVVCGLRESTGWWLNGISIPGHMVRARSRPAGRSRVVAECSTAPVLAGLPGGPRIEHPRVGARLPTELGPRPPRKGARNGAPLVPGTPFPILCYRHTTSRGGGNIRVTGSALNFSGKGKIFVSMAEENQQRASAILLLTRSISCGDPLPRARAASGRYARSSLANLTTCS
jgi:hypothetical protein